jgi:hypothetical protein
MNDDEVELLRTLNGNVEALRGAVKDEQETRGRQVGLLKAVLIVAVALALIGGTVNGLLLVKVRNQADQLAGNRVADCERGNVSRAAILAMFETLPDAVLDAIGSVTLTPRTPEQQAIVDRFLEQAKAVAAERTASQRADLAPRDCSPQVVNP